MRIGIVHHLGWAVAVTATPDHVVVDRRRIELVEPGLPAAPIHHEGGAHPMHASGAPLSDGELTELVARVRASAERATSTALDTLADHVARPITSLAVRRWTDDLPDDISRLRQAPYESRADSVMYRQVLASAAHARGWAVHRYDAKTVETDAAQLLGERATEVLHGPRATLGPPWTKDHRIALAATIVTA